MSSHVIDVDENENTVHSTSPKQSKAWTGIRSNHFSQEALSGEGWLSKDILHFNLW